MKAIIGKKVGMTTYHNAEGRMIPVTVVEAGPNVVTQVKTDDTDGYNAIQVGFGDASEKSSNKAMMGHFKKSKATPKRKLIEFRDFSLEANIGDEITAEIFDEGEGVNVTGFSKGKGFQGVVKRHGFRGVGMQTHGQHNRGRAPGSIGAASYPARVFKGMRMAGRMGNDRIMVRNLTVEKVYPERNLMLISGAVPGAKGSYVIIQN